LISGLLSTRIYYENEQIRDLKKLGSILNSLNNEQVNSEYKECLKYSDASKPFFLLGTTFLLIGVTSNLFTSLKGDIKIWPLALMGGALVIDLCGIPSANNSEKHKLNSIKLYNSLVKTH